MHLIPNDHDYMGEGMRVLPGITGQWGLEISVI